MAEGGLLYRLEKAAWLASDDIVARFPEKLSRLGSYVSYITDADEVKTVWYDKEDNASIVATYLFPPETSGGLPSLDTVPRIANDSEGEPIRIRSATIRELNENGEASSGLPKIHPSI